MNAVLNFVILFTAFCTPPAFAKNSQIVNAEMSIYTENWPPFTYEERGKLKGVAVEIVHAIQNEIHDKTEIQLVPWARGYHEVLTKPNVILFAVIHSKEREEHLHFLGPLGASETALFGLEKAYFNFPTQEQAKANLVVGVLQDSIYATLVKKAGFKKIEYTKNPEQEARLLAAGRIDLIANDPSVIKEAFKRIGLSETDIKKYMSLGSNEYYLSFSQDTNPETINNWKDALSKIKKNGTFAKIVQRWTPEREVLMKVNLTYPKKKSQSNSK